jgi:hypothetical protein
MTYHLSARRECMPFFADAMNEGAYILVEYEGKLTKEELDAGRLSAENLLKTYGCRKLLIDFTAALKRISIPDTYLFVESLKVLPPNMKIGLVIPPQHKWSIEFTERVAANRGICLGVHIDGERARSWLLSDSRSS